jgi:hypothetical protein
MQNPDLIQPGIPTPVPDPPPIDPPVQAERMLRFFEYGHLPADLAKVSQIFAMAAMRTVQDIAAGPERTVCLRKLLEAKDCAVRAALDARTIAGG